MQQTSLCFGDNLKVKAKFLHLFGDNGDQIVWNVTKVGDRTGREQSQADVDPSVTVNNEQVPIYSNIGLVIR